MNEKYIEKISDGAACVLSAAYDLTDEYTPMYEALEAMKIAVLADISVSLSRIAETLDAMS